MFHLLAAIPTITLDVAEVAKSTDQAHIESPLELMIYMAVVYPYSPTPRIPLGSIFHIV